MMYLGYFWYTYISPYFVLKKEVLKKKKGETKFSHLKLIFFFTPPYNIVNLTPIHLVI